MAKYIYMLQKLWEIGHAMLLNCCTDMVNVVQLIWCSCLTHIYLHM